MIKVLSKKEKISTLCSDWNHLARKHGTPLLSFEWFFSCMETFYSEKDIRIIIFKSESRTRAIAPLVSVKRKSTQWLELMGVTFLYEPCGLLYDSNESLRKLLAGITSLKLPVILQRVPSNSSIIRELRDTALFKGFFVEKETAHSGYIPVTTSWENYFSSLSAQRRYDLRRKRRRAEKHGKVHIRIFSPEVKELDKYLTRAFAVEAAGWKGRRGSALTKNKKLEKFFRFFLESACRNGTLRLCFYTIAERPVGMLIGLNDADCFWVLKLGYDEQWAHCSPGIQITNETIRYAFKSNLTSYEFLGSHEQWQTAWHPDTHPLSTVLFFPSSPAGAKALITEGGRVFLNKGKALFLKLATIVKNAKQVD
jgi:CelD/BcsL family acetyltransferase involved in cellulose biosynthesis